MKYIDSNTVIMNIIEHIEESKLLEINSTIDIDQQSFIVDINLKKYFQEQLSY